MRKRGYFVVLPSAARTATITAPATGSQTTYWRGGYNGIKVVADITAGTSLQLTFTILGYDPLSGKTWTLLASAQKTGTGTTELTVFPGAPATTNVSANDALPERFQISVTAGNTNSATYSVSAHMIP